MGEESQGSGMKAPVCLSGAPSSKDRLRPCGEASDGLPARVTKEHGGSSESFPLTAPSGLEDELAVVFTHTGWLVSVSTL